MRIRLLGPVELRTGAADFTALPGAQRRAVLALLALRLGRVVTVDAFCELLWGEWPPASARAALQGHVAALRKALAATPFVLHTRAPGYLLTGPSDEVDALRFEALAGRAAGHAGRHDGCAGAAGCADPDGCAGCAADGAAVAVLEEALRLWRGGALADLPDTAPRRALVEQLDQVRTRVLIAWAGLRLRQGSGAAAVPLLEQSVRADGLREEVVALLVRCLHQGGRQADALAAYHRARTRLDGELGIRPGPALQAAFAEVLAGGGGAPPTPRRSRPAGPAPTTPGPGRPAPQAHPVPDQLPRRPVDFVGRETELQWLDRLTGPDRADDGPALVVGPAGVGKSATVLTWAHRAAGRFPDGRLFADLRGFDPDGPADPAEVLGRFLLALGVPASEIPPDGAGRAARYRDRTHGRRLLVVLDNALDAEQVGDLLPGGAGCAVVVTSRGSLEGLLVAEGAALLRLAPLGEADALRLLERGLTPARVRAEPAAAALLAGLCDRLPLALRIAVARLAARPEWTIAELADELADERTRLGALEADGVAGVCEALELTYRHLSLDATLLFTLLAAHPGREVDTTASAALLGADPAHARDTLGELVAHHVLAETAPGRYGRPGLVRLFGVQLLTETPEGFRRIGTERLLDYYLEAAHHCGEQLEPGQDRYGEPVHPPTALPTAAGTRGALDWFAAEEPAIRALVTATASTDPGRSWRLAAAACPLYYGSSRFTDWLDCLRAGEQAARACGDRVGLALLHGAVANALLGLERRQEAVEVARRAVEDTTPADGAAHLRALATLALASALTGDPGEATRLAATAAALAGEGGDPRHLSYALGYQAGVSLLAGDGAGALRQAREARALLPGRPASSIQLWSMLTEAQALQALGRYEAGELAWHRVLATCEEAGLLHLQALAEQYYAAFLVDRGREPEAVGRMRSALGRLRSCGHLAGATSERAAAIEEALNARAGRTP
ncbi:BTAD domain-containing putative transcriptional regulator [Kitasatospora sp. RG8]|uniref:AfsR/SARP family transcriptional regulator n=1 Tax=Kitasatospora sp. RG8 TaxID=2820815 RepID=UPI001ADF3D48|nr:BTAD domain-containing putative transcriptional regulator [Kitasatospora sp. RG8]